MAGDDDSQDPVDENTQLTEAQKAAIDQIREILDTLPPERRRVFQKSLKGLVDGEKEGTKDQSQKAESEAGRRPNNAGSDSAYD